MFFDEATGNGYVLLTNGDAKQSGDKDKYNAYLDLGAKLMDLAGKLP
jgi:hypothetical protein